MMIQAVLRSNGLRHTWFGIYSAGMEPIDCLDLASSTGLPWVELSLVASNAIDATSLGPRLALPLSLSLPLTDQTARLKHAMPYQLLGLADPADCDRYTVRADEEFTLEFEESKVDDSELLQAPLVRYARHLLLHAITNGASDIHINPLAEDCQVLFRIDGFLVEQPKPPNQLNKRLLARIKVMANLDLTESGQAQDGVLSVEDIQGISRRFRVSVLPSLHGEKAVLRLVGHAQEIPLLGDLGFTPHQLNEVNELLDHTQGLILVTGPTGSGKSLTLGRILMDLARNDRHVASVEDPIEFELPNVHQVQLNRSRNLDFPASLRALLRQDPDVLMVGEIRDQETAEIALQAAETGHLVLSTLHTKRPSDAYQRLAHFGLSEPHLRSVLRIVIGQRLVRTLCAICTGSGCSECQNGYRGRTGLFQYWRPGDAPKPEHTDYEESIRYHLAHQRTTWQEITRVLGRSNHHVVA